MSREGNGRGLTPEAFEALLAILHPDREEAGKIYEQIRRRLVRLFEWRGCTCPDELADVTFDRVAQRLGAGLTLQRHDPYPYFCGVAHHVFQEVLRSEARKGKALESADWPPANPEEDEPDFRLDHLRRCLDKLGSLQRRLLLDYYRDDRRIQSRKDLCTEMGIELNALRIRVHRLRKKVESCIQERFQY